MSKSKHFGFPTEALVLWLSDLLSPTFMYVPFHLNKHKSNPIDNICKSKIIIYLCENYIQIYCVLM